MAPPTPPARTLSEFDHSAHVAARYKAATASSISYPIPILINLTPASGQNFSAIFFSDSTEQMSCTHDVDVWNGTHQ